MPFINLFSTILVWVCRDIVHEAGHGDWEGYTVIYSTVSGTHRRWVSLLLLYIYLKMYSIGYNLKSKNKQKRLSKINKCKLFKA